MLVSPSCRAGRGEQRQLQMPIVLSERGELVRQEGQAAALEIRLALADVGAEGFQARDLDRLGAECLNGIHRYRPPNGGSSITLPSRRAGARRSRLKALYNFARLCSASLLPIR